MANNSSCWYCPKCKEELDGCHVTYQELCEYCGTAVLSVPESISQETIEEIIKAKADGRLVVLPCKVGTRVWVIGQDCDLCHDMYTEEPCLFGDCEYRKVIESVFLPGMTDEFGKTVFLTREAAEKALSPICNTTKLPCAGCNPVCEHRAKS